ncbi:MAG: hypothetical protein JOZ25_02580 [Actinobacteria bacterium]|nr:hypothetical protein [Actinomycetota bacterium]
MREPATTQPVAADRDRHGGYTNGRERAGVFAFVVVAVAATAAWLVLLAWLLVLLARAVF